MRIFLLCFLVLAACAPAVSLPAAPVESSAPHTDPSLVGALADYNLAGAFAYAPLGRARTALACDNIASCSLRRTPASTFKIPHALFALDRGFITPSTVFPGTPYAEIPAWRNPLDLRGALAASSVPWFQEVARRLGPAKEQELLSLFEYGNQQMGSDLTHFWLNVPDGVRISPAQQVGFLDRLYCHDLPLQDPQSVAKLLEALPHENIEGRQIIGKTGWAIGQGSVAWYVGWVLPQASRDGSSNVEGTSFAIVLDGPSPGSAFSVPTPEQRKPLAFALLKKAGRL